MSDAHTPNLLSDADAAADLAGVSQLVSTMEAQALAAMLIVHAGDHKDVAYSCDMNPVHTLNWKHYETSLSASKTLLTLVSERDAIAARMAELESEVLDQCRLNGMGAERELALMGRVRELEAERDRLTLSRADRECLRIGQELQRAAGELPEGFVIEIAVELGYGGVTLIDKSYQNHEFSDTVDGLSHCITQAIDAALSTTPESKP